MATQALWKLGLVGALAGGIGLTLGEVRTAIPVLRSARPRITEPQVPEADRQAQTRGDNQLALDLYHWECGRASGNVFFSPLSISTAMAMVYGGARSETASQMAAALHFALPADRLHRFFDRLDLSLSGRAESASGGFQVRIANSLWSQEGHRFQSAFLDLLAEYYGASPRPADFRQSSAAARAINDWVGQATAGRIRDLISSDALTSSTALVLANAVCFKAAWARPFAAARTAPEDFHLLNGDAVQVPMMKQEARFRFASGEDYQALVLPYRGGFSMLILVPAAERFRTFESGLNAQRLAGVDAELGERQLLLSMPRWTVHAPALALTEALSDLGMKDAFTVGAADFSGMDGARDLSLSQVVHKAFIAVDEQGTEAAAATASVSRIAALQRDPETPLVVKVDRPFIYLIRDDATGATLFMGRVMDPR